MLQRIAATSYAEKARKHANLHRTKVERLVDGGRFAQAAGYAIEAATGGTCTTNGSRGGPRDRLSAGESAER